MMPNEIALKKLVVAGCKLGAMLPGDSTSLKLSGHTRFNNVSGVEMAIEEQKKFIAGVLRDCVAFISSSWVTYPPGGHHYTILLKISPAIQTIAYPGDEGIYDGQLDWGQADNRPEWTLLGEKNYIIQRLAEQALKWKDLFHIAMKNREIVVDDGAANKLIEDLSNEYVKACKPIE